MDHRSFRDQLAFSIGFAVSRSRALLRRILTEHAPDDARQVLAERVVEHLEQSGFGIDEAEQVMRKRPPRGEPRVGFRCGFSLLAAPSSPSASLGRTAASGRVVDLECASLRASSSASASRSAVRQYSRSMLGNVR